VDLARRSQPLGVLGDQRPRSPCHGCLLVGLYGEGLDVQHLVLLGLAVERRIGAPGRQEPTAGEPTAKPPQEREVLSLRGGVQLHEAHEQLEVRDAPEHGVERLGPCVRTPQPIRLVVKLEGDEQPLVNDVALGEAAREDRVVVLGRPCTVGSHRALEGIVNDREHAEVCS
jgi:hypothetical protein